MITFEECQIAGYPARTKKNILKADVTIALALDFNTAGERLTKNFALDNGKIYIPLRLQNEEFSKERIDEIVRRINRLYYSTDSIIINIAGNGLYSLPNPQNHYNLILADMIYWLRSHPHMPSIEQVISGGQTGIDEAGIIGASSMLIPAHVLAPKYWMFRDQYHKDICDEHLFKARF